MLQLSARAAILGSTAAMYKICGQASVYCVGDLGQDCTNKATSQVIATPAASRGTIVAAVATSASVMAAAAPALCAVHCAAMPLIVAVLPSLQLGVGMCMHRVARKLAIYVVVPLGLLSNGVGYSQHQNVAVTSTSLLGISCVTAAATLKQLAPRRNILSLVGCGLMFGASYRGHQLEHDAGGCSHCCDTNHATSE